MPAHPDKQKEGKEGHMLLISRIIDAAALPMYLAVSARPLPSQHVSAGCCSRMHMQNARDEDMMLA